jgi:hypothetical protein
VSNQTRDQVTSTSSQNLVESDTEYGSELRAPPLSGFGQRVVAIIWPAFLMAGVIEMLVFAFADPDDLHWLGGSPVTISRSAVYTLAFFAFWIIVSTAGALTQLLLQEPGEVNHQRRQGPHWP